MEEKKAKSYIIYMLLVVISVLGSGIFLAGEPGRAGEAGEELLLATTTSTDNTGSSLSMPPKLRSISSPEGSVLIAGQ
jgi:ABC-type tungstate transport system permease subunit